MKRLRLVQLPVPPPAALAATGNVPLAAGCLGVAARVHGLDRSLEIEVVSPEVTDTFGDAQLADHVARDEPEFVGLSLYLWNTERSLHLAREVKARSPRTTVLIGGPEVSPDNPFVLAQPGWDVAVTGEAEDAFAGLMHRLLDGGDVGALPGVALKGGAFNPAPTVNFPLTQYPSPYTLGLVPVEARRSTYVETVRGCRSHCTFCFYPKSSGSLRSLAVDQAAQLIANVRDRGAREVVFLDPTFNHRPDFEPLLDALAEVNHDRALTFFAEVRAEGLTPSHAAKLKRAGFDRLELGLQSVNVSTLKRVKRGGSPQKVAAAAKLLHEHGISLLVDLIVGLPGDTATDVLDGIDFLNTHGLADEAQVFGLSLLPGTAMRATAAADGVEFDPAPPYRVLRTATMSRDELQQTLAEAERRLGRRLDERPRPHLVGAGPDVTRVGEAVGPGARHVALWADAEDLFAQRHALGAAIDARVKVDPYCTLDVVLVARRGFPLDMVDFVRAQLNRAPASYLTRTQALRGEDLQRRICVVVPAGAQLPGGWVEAVSELVPVFRDQRAGEAVDGELGARVVGAASSDEWRVLSERGDPDEVVFAERELEARWLQHALS